VYVPIIVELPALRVPVKVKLCVPAIAVRVIFWPVTVPVIGAEPLLQSVGEPPCCAGNRMA
jgi:hypothetical protein